MIKLREQFPVELDKIYRLDVTSMDSVPTLRVKVDEYKESSDEEMDHVVRRFLNVFKGQHSQDKGNTILPVGTYLVDIVDYLDWTAGEFGDVHSCYWNTYSGTRQRMAADGTWAMRVHLTPNMPEYDYMTFEDYAQWHQGGVPNAYGDKEGVREAHIEEIMGGRWGGSDLDVRARSRAARAYFVPWWRMAERPGVTGEGQVPGERPIPRPVEFGASTEEHKDAFGDRWPGSKASAVMHNPYGGLHMGQLAGLYTKLTGLQPNSIDHGQSTFGAAVPHGQDWIFARMEDYYNKRLNDDFRLCHHCGCELNYMAARRMSTKMTAPVYSPASEGLIRMEGARTYNARVWHCMDCIVELGRKSETSGRWTRTKGLKWYA